MPRRLTLIATTVVLALLLAGCGGDDDASDDTTTTTVEETTTTEGADEEEPDGTTTEPSSDPEDTTGSTEPPDDETTTTTGGTSGGGDFCATFAAFEETFEELPDDTVEQIQTAVDALHDGLDELEAVAPDEITDDMAVLTEGGDRIVTAVAGTTTVDEAMQAVTDIFGEPEFTAAAERVDDHFDETCPEANDDQADG